MTHPIDPGTLPYNAEVANALGFLLGRCANLGGTGMRPEPFALTKLVLDFEGVVPRWYHCLILDYPICGRILGWQSKAPQDLVDGIEWLQWAHPQDTYKWLCTHRDDFIARKRLIHIANNPFERVYYFISSEVGDDPPIYRLDCRASFEVAKRAIHPFSRFRCWSSFGVQSFRHKHFLMKRKTDKSGPAATRPCLAY